MTDEELDEVLRQYLRTRVNEPQFKGNKTKFAKTIDYAKPSIVHACNGTRGVPIGIITAISATIGPSLSEIFASLARLCSEAERQKIMGQELVRSQSGARAAVRTHSTAVAVRAQISADEKKRRKRKPARRDAEQPKPAPSGAKSPSRHS